MKGPVVPRVIKANNCRYLKIVKLLDADSPSSSTALNELSVNTEKLSFETALEGSSRLFATTRVLTISPTCAFSLSSFGGLERLTLKITRIHDINRGQLSGLVRLKELHLIHHTKDRHGIVFCQGIILL
jgi:hypothetical protein